MLQSCKSTSRLPCACRAIVLCSDRDGPLIMRQVPLRGLAQLSMVNMYHIAGKCANALCCDAAVVEMRVPAMLSCSYSVHDRFGEGNGREQRVGLLLREGECCCK